MLSAVHVGLQALALASTSGNNYPGIRLWEGIVEVKHRRTGECFEKYINNSQDQDHSFSKIKSICESMLRMEKSIKVKWPFTLPPPQ